ncbi:MAG: FUSC family protein [Bacteroidales bacterium]|nr:FUSC family protein [Bacteroidales bacterium]
MKHFTHNFLENEYFLSRHKNSFFSALTVGLCIIAACWFELGFLASGLIIGAQSITGINRQGAFRIRLRLSFMAVFVLSGAAVLGAVAAMGYFPFALLSAVLFAFLLGCCRQWFPLNWPDIVIPSGVIFFLNYTTPMVWMTFGGAVAGFGLELLLGLAVYIKRYNNHKMIFAPTPEKLPLPPDVPDKTILGLKEYLFTYSLELSLVLIAGFFIIRYKIADYPHIYWIPLTAIIVLKVGRRATLKRVFERTAGTLAGCLLGSGILYLQMGFIVESVAMVACIYLFIYYLKNNYMVAAVFITTFILLLLHEGNLPTSFLMTGERLIFTLMGGILATLVSLIFLKKERL